MCFNLFDNFIGGDMFAEQNVTIVNAGASVTPLNFRHWLRKELVRQRFSGKRSGNVEAYVFVTKAFITALGRKKLDKIISNEVSKHHWIADAQVVTTSAAVSDDEARDYIEEEEFEGSPKADDSEFGILLMGFDHHVDPETRLVDLLTEPTCVIRPIIEADVERISMEGGEYPYVVGEFAVIGHVNDEAFFSEPFETMEAAKIFAEKTYGAVSYLETRGVA